MSWTDECPSSSCTTLRMLAGGKQDRRVRMTQVVRTNSRQVVRFQHGIEFAPHVALIKERADRARKDSPLFFQRSPAKSRSRFWLARCLTTSAATLFGIETTRYPRSRRTLSPAYVDNAFNDKYASVVTTGRMGRVTASAASSRCRGARPDWSSSPSAPSGGYVRLPAAHRRRHVALPGACA